MHLFLLLFMYKSLHPLEEVYTVYVFTNIVQNFSSEIIYIKVW